MGPDEISAMLTGFTPSEVELTPLMIDDDAVARFNERWSSFNERYPEFKVGVEGQPEDACRECERIAKHIIEIIRSNNAKNSGTNLVKEHVMTFEYYSLINEDADHDEMRVFLTDKSKVDKALVHKMTDEEVEDLFLDIKTNREIVDKLEDLRDKYSELDAEIDSGDPAIDKIANELYINVIDGDIDAVMRWFNDTDNDTVDTAASLVAEVLGGEISIDSVKFEVDPLGKRLLSYKPIKLDKSEYRVAISMFIRAMGFISLTEVNSEWYIALVESDNDMSV